MLLDYLLYLIPMIALALGIRFCYIYFTSADYADHQERSLQIFLPLAATTLVLAVYLVVTEILARARIFPMTVFPIEHSASLQRVGLNLVLAMAGFFLAWLASRSRRVAAILPGARVILLIPMLAVLLSATANYVSLLGFCCETPPAIFFGFPFTFLYGIVGSDTVAIALAKGGLMTLISELPAIVYNWGIRPFSLLLDGLFWINSCVSLLVIRNLVKIRFQKQTGNHQ